LTPLPGALGGRELVAWRIEVTRHFSGWQDAEGAFRVGGRWSSAGRRVLYTSIDPSTAILEVAVHKGLQTLDIVPHTLLELGIEHPGRVFVVTPDQIAEPAWLRPGTVSAVQQAFGDSLLTAHPLLLLPSVVSTHSWNLLIDVPAAQAAFSLRRSEAFALDPRLRAAGPPRTA
jgi:RES domain-containing protein